MTGIKNAKVFPLPVTACILLVVVFTQYLSNLIRTSTTTSLCVINSGMVEACTGVMRLKPIEEIASRSHSDSGRVSASQAREELVGTFGDTV